MNRRDPGRVRQVFWEALDLPEFQRTAFLDAACGGDAGLREEVCSLLRHVPDQDSGFLVTPPEVGGRAVALREAICREATPVARAGDRFGPYEILDLVGEGGMSLVYRAVQHEPLRREVAVKILKPGMDSGEVLRRFENERRILAAMDHPHIARVLDAGTCPRGRAFVVMEHVRGTSINRFCDDSRLDVRGRIALFVGVCNAVEHAHMRGIIHRDLKPTNILVAAHPGAPLPKIIDFGVAKAVGEAGAGHTHSGQMVGTPAYMSPEQWDGVLDLDVRADVFALGLVLHELVTGMHPHMVDRFDSMAPHAVRDMIRHAEAVRPSTRVLRAGAASDEVVVGVSRASLVRMLRSDLDWIILKAIERDRTRRYRSVEALARDLTRYLERRPIEARPPSLGYRAAMHVRRRPVLSAMGGVSLAGVVLAGAAVTYHSRRLGDELRERTRVLAMVEKARAEADARASELARMSGFQSSRLGSVVPAELGDRIRGSVLDAVGPDDAEPLARALADVNFTNIGLEVMNQELFEPTRRAIGEDFADEPLLRASLLHSLAEAMQRTGLWHDAMAPQEVALSLRREHLGMDHPDTLLSLHRLATLHAMVGQREEAESMLFDVFTRRGRVLGWGHSDTIASGNNLSLVFRADGRDEKAAALLKQLLEDCSAALGEDSPVTMTVRHNYGAALGKRDSLPELLELHQKNLKARLRVLGPEHPDTLDSQAAVGLVARELGRFDLAERAMLACLEARRRQLGDGHVDTLVALSNLGALHAVMGRTSEGEAALRTAFDGLSKSVSADHPFRMFAAKHLGRLLVASDRSEEGVRFMRVALDACVSCRHAASPECTSIRRELFEVLRATGRSEEVEPLARSAWSGVREVPGLAAEERLGVAGDLAVVLMDLMRWDEAETMLRDAIAVAEQELAADAPGLMAGRALLDAATRRVSPPPVSWSSEASAESP